MNVFTEGRKGIQEKFESEAFPIWLYFKDEKLEEKYQINKAETLKESKYFKISAAAILIILAARRIELLVFNIIKIQSISGNVEVEYIQTALMIAAYSIELLVACVDKFKKAKGIFIMLYMFFVAVFSSYYYISVPCTVPM